MRIDSKDEVFEQTRQLVMRHGTLVFMGKQTLGCAGLHEQWMAIFSEQIEQQSGGVEHPSEPCKSIVLWSDLPFKTKTRWWQLKYFLFSPLFGEMIQF